LLLAGERLPGTADGGALLGGPVQRHRTRLYYQQDVRNPVLLARRCYSHGRQLYASRPLLGSASQPCGRERPPRDLPFQQAVLSLTVRLCGSVCVRVRAVCARCVFLCVRLTAGVPAERRRTYQQSCSTTSARTHCCERHDSSSCLPRWRTFIAYGGVFVCSPVHVA
jgi:hypothetical protein